MRAFPLLAALLVPGLTDTAGKLPEATWWKHQGCPRLERLGATQFLRKGFPYVEQSYFVDEAGLRKQVAKGSPGPVIHAALREGPGLWLGCRMRMLASIGAARRRAFLAASLQRCWPDGSFSLDRPEVQAFLTENGRLLNEQETFDYLFSPHGALYIRYGSGEIRKYTHPELVRAMRRLEFEDDVENPDALAGMAREWAKRF